LVKAQLGNKTHWQDSGELAMMFHGTYTSEFYRAIRDLLHDRVSLETLNAPAQAGEYHRGRCTLERRWQDLVSSERRYRNASGHAS
jgi:anaerobic magnesium-protoporphyrin IX monomethyl ester cyclase